jgi:hypothetical protein
VKVATFNINKRLDNLLDWLAKAEPDVASLPGPLTAISSQTEKIKTRLLGLGLYRSGR